MNYGELEGNRILNRSTYELMWKPAGPRFQNVGLCWHLAKHGNWQVVYHSASDKDFTSYVALLPERSFGLVLASNFSETPSEKIVKDALNVVSDLEK